MSFEGVKIGDLVRVTYEFQVTGISKLDNPTWIEDAHGCTYYDDIFDGDTPATIEILPPPLPTEDGWYESERFPLSEHYHPYQIRLGVWHYLGEAKSTEDMSNFVPLHKIGRI